MQDKKLRFSVAGGGSWGTALAQTLAENGHTVNLVLRDSSLAKNINETRENARYLSGYVLSANIFATSSMSCMAKSDVIVLAVPAQSLRGFLQDAYDLLPENVALVNTAKGLECHSKKTMQQVVQDVLGKKNPRYAILSGPSFAAEVMQKHPTAVVLGCAGSNLGKEMLTAFSSDYFRCYSGSDVLGIELGGALKNIMAIAAGLCDGLGFGHNSRAALLTRGLAEMSRLGAAMGADPITFMGLSGLGDLMLTCTGDLSRNRQVGLRLGKGESLEQILTSLGMVAEGVKTTEAVYSITQELQVSTPIIQAVYDILYKQIDPKQSVVELMSRRLKGEY